jgi:peptidase E
MARYAAVKGITDPQEAEEVRRRRLCFVPDASDDKTWMFRRKLEA